MISPSRVRLTGLLTVALLGLAVVGCSAAGMDRQSVESGQSSLATSVPESTPTLPTLPPVAEEGPADRPLASDQAAPRPTSEPSVVAADQLPDDPTKLMKASLDLALKGDGRAFRKMADSGKGTYLPVLVEYLRFPWWQVDEELRPTAVESLQRLAVRHVEQAEFNYEEAGWGEWVAWVGKHPEIQPPEGFAGWKGELFAALVDPDMGAFLYDNVPSTIRIEEIVWGGVIKDGIPDLTSPPVIAAEEATYLHPEERVFGVSINGEHRAYPHRILNPHEMANDVVGGVAFALAY